MILKSAALDEPRRSTASVAHFPDLKSPADRGAGGPRDPDVVPPPLPQARQRRGRRLAINHIPLTRRVHAC